MYVFIEGLKYVFIERLKYVFIGIPELMNCFH